jgi:hypothetical protein
MEKKGKSKKNPYQPASPDDMNLQRGQMGVAGAHLSRGEGARSTLAFNTSAHT